MIGSWCVREKGCMLLAAPCVDKADCWFVVEAVVTVVNGAGCLRGLVCTYYEGCSPGSLPALSQGPSAQRNGTSSRLGIHRRWVRHATAAISDMSRRLAACVPIRLFLDGQNTRDKSCVGH